MRRIQKAKYSILFIASFSFFISSALAQSNVAEKIDSFTGEIKINSDSTIEVTENIQYDFGENERHGIYRFIPVKYKARGGNYNLRVSNVSVTDEAGNPYNFTTSYQGNNIQFKIGDPDKYVSGTKNYVINYVIRRAVNYFPDHDELYWNFTGDEWEVSIENASMRVILPEEASGNLRHECFEGRFGSNIKCSAESEGNSITYTSNGELAPGEGMTIVAGWPKGITPEPTLAQKILDIARDNWTLIVPVFVFVLMFRLWWKKGRDPKGRGTVIAQYEPPDKLTPAEIGTMLDGSADSQDVSATMIDLAVRGFLKIKRTEKKGFFKSSAEYTFSKLKDEEPAEEFEKKIMQGIFGNAGEKKLTDLKNKFYKTLAEVKSQLYKNVTEKGYYTSNPNRTRIAWILGGVFGGIFLAVLFGILQGGWGVFGGIISGIILVVFGWLMPSVTRKGAELKENILGFKDFLSVTEKDRLKFHNAPEKNPEMFERFLPFAMVLGVEKEWAKQFEGIYNQQPGWYEDSSGRPFNAIILAGAVSGFSDLANTALASSPSSASGGGSGFSGGGSGGGFGGGGGGSW